MFGVFFWKIPVSIKGADQHSLDILELESFSAEIMQPQRKCLQGRG